MTPVRKGCKDRKVRRVLLEQPGTLGCKAMKATPARKALQAHRGQSDRKALSVRLATPAFKGTPAQRGRLGLNRFGTSLALTVVVPLTPLVTLLPTVDQRGIELMLTEATSVTLQSKDHSGRRLLRRVLQAQLVRKAL